MACNEAKKARKRKRTFQTSWLDEDIFKGWLSAHPTENQAFCTVCNSTIRCCKPNLIRHSQTVKHVEKIINTNNGNRDTMSHQDKVKRAEIKLAAFFAEHNIAFSVADHLIPLLKDICRDPEVVSDLSLGRDKCRQIISEVIAKRESDKIVTNLRDKKLSILIDETTDISDTKFMCVLVRYLSPINNTVKTQLLELLPLDATDSSASKMFDSFQNLFKEKKIPLKNIVGMASDNASVMIGCHNSFTSRLKLESPGLVSLNCICHSAAIISSKACETLPPSCENLVRGVATYISGSAKRCAILGEFQDFFNTERNKILKPSNTRWLVLHKCIVRLLQNWDILKNYFILAVVEDKLKSAESLLELLNDERVKAYLLFLKYSLNYFNNFNALFQSRKILIHRLFEDSQKLIRDIAENFIIAEALEDICNLDVDNVNIRKNINNICVGLDCESFLRTQSFECAREVKLNILHFYITAVREMLKRLPYNDIIFKQLMFLQPKIALYNEGRTEIKDLNFIATRIGNINLNNLASEWEIIPSIYNDNEKKALALLEIDEMWRKILKFKGSNGENIFPNLESLVEAVLSFPHSNAEAERIFSMVTDIKNKKRNRLSNDILSAICVIRSTFQAEGINCLNFEIDAEHLTLHDAKNLWKTKNSSDSH